MKKFITTILATSAAALGLLITGTANASAATTYTVKPGDSVWAISHAHKTTIAAVEKINHITGHLILPGQELTIPTAKQTKAVQAAPQNAATTAQQATNNSTAPTTDSSYSGNDLKSYVLSQMASRTGVPAATWDAIITRESNWQPNVVNSTSGAYGLFQNMHISGGNVQQQIDAAVALYNSQGMGAWAM